jgi:hypothetical protein
VSADPDALASGGQAASEFPSTAAGTGVTSCSKEKSWIDIQLLDAGGQPLAGEPYKLELPDGTVIEGMLDAQGCAGVEVMDPGNCKVTFPNFADGLQLTPREAP